MSEQETNENQPANSEHAGGPKTEHLKPWQFAPGQSGNPSGRPKKRPITEIYEKILADEGNVALITAAVLKNLTSGRMAGVLTLNEMAERVEGKVTQPVDVNGELTLTLSERIEKARAKLNGDTGE